MHFHSPCVLLVRVSRPAQNFERVRRLGCFAFPWMRRGSGTSGTSAESVDGLKALVPPNRQVPRRCSAYPSQPCRPETPRFIRPENCITQCYCRSCPAWLDLPCVGGEPFGARTARIALMFMFR